MGALGDWHILAWFHPLDEYEQPSVGLSGLLESEG